MEESRVLAEQLRAGLAAAGINQAELARRAGVTRAYVGRLLGGSQAAPTPEVVAALASALELPAAARVRLYAAAGMTPPELAAALGRPVVARLLTALAATPGAERDRLEGALGALLDTAGEPVVARLLTALATAPAGQQTRLTRLLAALLALLDEPAVTRLLLLLAHGPAGRRDRLIRLLSAALDLAEAAEDG